jgi:hypothetical protein
VWEQQQQASRRFLGVVAPQHQRHELSSVIQYWNSVSAPCWCPSPRTWMMVGGQPSVVEESWTLVVVLCINLLPDDAPLLLPRSNSTNSATYTTSNKHGPTRPTPRPRGYDDVSPIRSPRLKRESHHSARTAPAQHHSLPAAVRSCARNQSSGNPLGPSGAFFSALLPASQQFSVNA